MHVIAAKAVCFEEALKPEFKTYQEQIIKNAQALCKGLQKRDVKIVSGGTDNHLMLVDLTPYDLTGKVVEKLLDSRISLPIRIRFQTIRRNHLLQAESVLEHLRLHPED